MTEYQIICSDIMTWCEEYTGPKFHAILTDCPFEMSFMSKKWDGTGISFQKETWSALAEHLLPGGFVFAFASSRGWHRLACAMEDAGLIIQPSIFGWLNGQSFPKATRIDTQIDKAAGMTGKAGYRHRTDGAWSDGWKNSSPQTYDEPLPATDLARAWEGHRYGGQILKDALTPIIVAQKPWEGKRLDCIVDTGAGALNIDAARIHAQPGDRTDRVGGTAQKWGTNTYAQDEYSINVKGSNSPSHPQGRWPSNFCLVHSAPHWLCRDCGCSYPMQLEFQPCPHCGGALLWLGGCERVGVKRVKGQRPGSPQREKTSRGLSGGGYGQERSYMRPISTHVTKPGHADPDGYERVDAWICNESCPARKLGEQSGRSKDGKAIQRHGGGQRIGGKGIYQGSNGLTRPDMGYESEGTAARFFYQADWSHEIAERIANADPVRYCPKAARKERANGLDDFYWRKDKKALIGFVRISQGEWEALGEEEERIHEETGKRVSLRAQGNIHPTCKPISLNVWLAKLLAPPKEYVPRRILIPFCGTMSEGIGALLSGGWEEIVGIDSEQDYCDIGEARMGFWSARPRQEKLF